MIEVEKLCKAYGTRQIFKDFDLNVKDGDVIALIGPSGSGKSLLLRMLMMLERPDSGTIILDGENVTAEGADLDAVHQKVGMVFQNFNLFNHLSVLENVMSGLVDLQNIPKDEAVAQARSLLKTVGMADKAFVYPDTLSGGQKQRAAIARTLAMKPDLILLDEPTSALDPMMRGEVEAVIRMMAASGHTMIIATHEMELVRQICNRVCFIYDGSVYEEGTPEKIFENPDRTRTRRFVQALRVLEFDVASKDFDFIGTQTAFEEFAYRNGVSRDLLGRLESIMEELFQMVIIQPKEDNVMHVSFEYNNREKCLSGVVRFSGPKLDPDDPHYFISWPIICRRASEVEVQDIDDGQYTNLVNIIIK